MPPPSDMRSHTACTFPEYKNKDIYKKNSEEYISKLQELGAVGEAFGCYFNKNSEVVSENTPIGININDAKKINTHIAVAAGENKVEAIIAAEMNNSNAVLVTDEAAGRKIAELIKLNK